MKIATIYTLGAFVLLTGLSACTKGFQGLNTDPNAITHVGVETILPSVERNASNTLVGEGWSVGNLVIQQTAKFQFVNVDRYNWGEMATVWNDTYANLRDLKFMDKTSESKGQKTYQAVTMILRSWSIALLTDLYGDVPYSEAFKADEGLGLAKYDTQEQIYNQIIVDLNKANTILANSNEIINGDFIYNGSELQWRKFANSLLIRTYMRISKKRAVSVELQKILSNPSQYPIFTATTDDAVYRYTPSQPNQFPIYRYRSGSFDEIRLSKTMKTMMDFYKDPRLTVFADPISASQTPQYVGMPNGLADADALAYNGGSNHISKVGNSFFQNSISPIGLQRAKGYFMGYAELQFLLAEAAKKAWIPGGDAQAKNHYEAGIKSAFESIVMTLPTSYLKQANVSYQPNIALEQIGNQMWIALFNTGFEAWNYWRRTGFPVLQPGVNNVNSNRIPVRFMYPLQEQRLNKTNYDAAVSRQGIDNINTKVWWQK